MIQKAFITKRGKANFSCPECNKTRQMNVSQFKDIEKEVKLKCKCSCGHTFSVILERRQYIRKAVNLNGELIVKKLKLPVRVVDVSRMGLKIQTRNDLNLEIDSKVIVNFVLDDVGQSRISKELIVKSNNATSIGLEFLSPDHYDKFGNYILFQPS